MTLSEFNKLAKNTAQNFSGLTSYKHITYMKPDEILMRTFGELFYCHITQNDFHIPSEDEYDFDDYDTEEEFYYDYNNHIVGTTEYHLTEAFINLSLLCRNLGYFPCDGYKKMIKETGENDVSYYYIDRVYNKTLTQTIRQLISEAPIVIEDLQKFVNFQIGEMLWNIILLSERLGFNIKKLIDYKYKFETF